MSNVVLNAGAGGATLGTDQVAGIDYQKMKVTFSTDGTAPTSVDATHGLPDNLVQVGGNTVKTGSGAGSAGSLNVYLATDQPTLTNALSVSQSGSWTVGVTGIVADATAFTRGTTVELPVGGVVEALQAGLTVAQTRALSLTTGALLRVDGSNVTQPVSGTVTANAGSGTFTVAGTVTANIGTTNGLALDTSVNGLLVAQGSTTSGEKGPLIQGAVTTAAPSYTTAQTSPLSLTTTGLLRVDGSGVTQPVSGTVTTTPPSNASTNVAQFGGTNVSTGTGAGGAGIPRVTVSNDSNILSTQSGTWTVQPGNTANTTPWLVTDVPGTSPGSTRSRVKAAASTNSTNLKGSAGVVLGYALYNNTASAKFFKFYDKATAPTVGTDTPAFTIIIPASGGANVSFETGVPFSTGIGYGITGAVTDADTTATAADDVHGFVLWK